MVLVGFFFLTHGHMFLEAPTNQRLDLSGHSMGAAAATLMAGSHYPSAALIKWAGRHNGSCLILKAPLLRKAQVCCCFPAYLLKVMLDICLFS